MSKNLARLRKVSAERGAGGSAESRDLVISSFLSELSEVVCDEVVDGCSDEVLYHLYQEWAKALCDEEPESDRRSRLVSAVVVFPATSLKREDPTNVVALYG